MECSENRHLCCYREGTSRSLPVTRVFLLVLLLLLLFIILKGEIAYHLETIHPLFKSQFWCVHCLYNCLCECERVQFCVHVHSHACGGQKTMLEVFLNSSLPHFFQMSVS